MKDIFSIVNKKLILAIRKIITEKDIALKKLQKYCAYQDRCHQEVRSKLLDLKIYGEDLEDIIVSLIEDNYLNEERFACSYARGRFRMKQWGRVRIKQELKRRKISAYCLKKAMAEIEEEEYLKTLEHLLKKKNKVLREPNIFKRKAKLATFVVGKGYEASLVWENVHALFDKSK